MQYGDLSRIYVSTSNWQDIMPDKIVKNGTGTIVLENGILKCRSDATNESAYVYLPFVMSPGSMCEVRVMARRQSGLTDPTRAGGLAFNNYTAPQNYVGGNLQDINNISNSEWQLYQYSIAGSPDKPFFALFIGAFTSSIGEWWFKDLKITWFGGNAPQVKFGKVYKDGSTFKVDQAPDGINSQGILKVVAYADYFRVHFTNNEYWQAPVVQANIYSGHLGWTAHVGATYRGYCDIKVCNASGQVVNPSTITGSFGMSIAVYG